MVVVLAFDRQRHAIALGHDDAARPDLDVEFVHFAQRERLLVELKDRFKAWETAPSLFTLVSDGPQPVASASTAETDAVSALISLGYKPQEASRAVAAIDAKGLSSEELIRRSLKGMI